VDVPLWVRQRFAVPTGNAGLSGQEQSGHVDAGSLTYKGLRLTARYFRYNGTVFALPGTGNEIAGSGYE
jgi:hypothetical protein